MQGKKIYIIGIGGIGLSALAQLYLHEGAEVSGSDRSDSPTTALLRSKGVQIFIGQDAKHVPEDASLIVYSDAVYEDNAERIRAKELGILQLSYFEALGKVTKGKKVIAISGAHGKTSTTAMLIDVFEAAGLDPTAVVGSLRAKTKSNFRAGKSEYFIVEADEFRRHFLHFTPHILVINNIDADHLDYYKDLADIQSAFAELAHKVPTEGYIVCDPTHPNVAPVLEGVSAQVVDFKKFYDNNLPLKVLPLNRKNAAPVLAVADIVGISQDSARSALGQFTGTWRRFEYKGTTESGALVYDDYAHHPAEIALTLKSVREQFPDKKVIVIFHPHLYSRTKLLMHEFATAFMDADKILIAPIFAAREAPDPSVSSEILVAKIVEQGKDAQTIGSLQEIAAFIKNTAGAGDLVITMGAGDVYKAGEEALETK
jgi:UDP-N-acetylmuramate--alanine ligase